MVEGREIFVRASIGVADNYDDALDADELLCRADIAMYAAKARGRDRFEVFEPHMQAELVGASRVAQRSAPVRSRPRSSCSTTSR